ncbi:radical SAM protein [Kitasatospora sp. NA04385]|nr:radical SAM protein [Kitasatospora sp. NA04385]
MLTFACTASCTSCSTLSHPGNRSRIPVEDALRAIEEAAELGFANVVFTGGEATLRWDDLLTCLRRTTELGLPTRLVTNAHWAVTEPEAARVLDALLDAGLHEINFSTGDEHARFVPLAQVALAAATAVRRGLTAHVMVELREGRAVTAERLMAEPAIAELPEDLRESVRPSESPWMPIRPLQVERYRDGVAATRRNLPDTVGCESVLQTYTVQADGRIGACCGLAMRLVPELNVGRLQAEATLRAAIDEAESDVLKVWLRTAGPERILAWAADRDPEIAWEGMYGHRCQACLRIYKDPRVGEAIAEGYRAEVPGIVQSAWMQERYLPQQLASLPLSS